MANPYRQIPTELAEEIETIICDLLNDMEAEKSYYHAQSVANADDFLKKLYGEYNNED